ncbi:response regulator transcription factor [Rhizobium lusitanum]|uniref:winged helix-turn-helix transcriptional regulator n=1 Tax=Rhizobium lusitanum TaxID=293958 RepID=UPI0019597F55|nr:response regulator transcription factor [Rhizobium lusitanum]MBM7045717.1 response regulator transcription factor [Rhizobium lusitanum]
MDFRILIHSHDAQMFLLLQHLLAIEGFPAALVRTLDETVRALRDDSVRVVIINGATSEMELGGLRSLKIARPEIAIALLCNEFDKLSNPLLEKDGADLVLTRPFDPVRLIAFLRSLRSDALIEKSGVLAEANVLHYADLEMNSATAKVQRNGRDVPLTALQFRLLRHLLQNLEAVQSREALIAAAWPADADVEPRTVDIHIGLIRRALRTLGPDLIRTVRTRGYALGIQDHLENWSC